MPSVSSSLFGVLIHIITCDYGDMQRVSNKTYIVCHRL